MVGDSPRPLYRAGPVAGRRATPGSMSPKHGMRKQLRTPGSMSPEHGMRKQLSNSMLHQRGEAGHCVHMADGHDGKRLTPVVHSAVGSSR